MSDVAGVAAPSPNLTLVATSVCAAVLALSAVGHLRTGALRYELGAHGVVPVPLRRFVAGSVTLAESLLALALVGSLVLGGPVLRTALGLSTVLFGGYCVYALVVLNRAPEARSGCGCGVGEHPMGLPTAVRAAGLAVLAVTGALAGGAPLRPDGLLVSVLMSVAVVCLAVWLPASLSQPGRLTVEQSR